VIRNPKEWATIFDITKEVRDTGLDIIQAAVPWSFSPMMVPWMVTTTPMFTTTAPTRKGDRTDSSKCSSAVISPWFRDTMSEMPSIRPTQISSWILVRRSARTTRNPPHTTPEDLVDGDGTLRENRQGQAVGIDPKEKPMSAVGEQPRIPRSRRERRREGQWMMRRSLSRPESKKNTH
jgi:hypothetical protein